MVGRGVEDWAPAGHADPLVEDAASHCRRASPAQRPCEAGVARALPSRTGATGAATISVRLAGQHEVALGAARNTQQLRKVVLS